MPFFFRYVVVYALVAVLLLGFALYAIYARGWGTTASITLIAFTCWLLVYHPVVVWRDYRRARRLIADIRAGRYDARVDSGHVRESVTELVAEYAGVPALLAAPLVQRALTDELVQELVTRLRTRPRGAGG